MSEEIVTENTVVGIFSNIKVYQVDARDSHFKKFDLISNNGCLEIYIIDQINQVNLKLISNGINSLLDTIHFNTNLNDFNLVMNKSKRAELKRVDSINHKYYAIEFIDNDDSERFRNCLDYLKEIYKQNDPIINDIEIVVSEKEAKIDLQDLCLKLKETISNGDVTLASMYAYKLAELKVNLNINQINNETEKIVVDISQTQTSQILDKKRIEIIVKHDSDFNKLDECKEKLEIYLNTSSTKVFDLKKLVSNHYKIPIEQQSMIIINECQTNDDDFIEDYAKSLFSKPDAASNLCSENDIFVVYVIAIPSVDIMKEEWVCNECSYENIGERCTNCCVMRSLIIDDSKKRFSDDEITIFKKHKQEKIKENYFEIAAADLAELNENIEPFNCDICMEENIEPFRGVILKECLHIFCKECLKNHINYSDDPDVKCPFSKDYNCNYYLQDREIRALLNKEDYSKYQMRSLRKSEATMQNAYHCKTPDCIGFCIAEELNFFDCPVCEKVNCLRCNIIHMGKTCKEYQDDLKLNAINDETARKDQQALEKMIALKKAMYCPGCKIILCKNNDGGCDWLQCGVCKMEICWATRGPRWGPGGHGDNSGGCKCNFLNGKMCHPKCGNCH